MNKKTFAVLMILISLVSIALILGAIFGLARKEAKKGLKQPAATVTTPEILENIDTSNWETYRNEEFGFEFKHQGDCNVDADDKIETFDAGKKTVVSLGGSQCKNKIIFTLTSSDYGVGIGEGCCFYYPGASIDTESPIDEINILIKNFRPIETEKVKINNRDAIHFYGLKGYVDISLVDYILLPYSRNGFSNLLIESPALFISQYEEGKAGKNQEQEIIKSFNNKEYSKNSDQIFNAVMESLNFLR